MEKAMELWKKLWYYTENYGTLIYTMEKNYGTMEKIMVLYKIIVYSSIFLLGLVEIGGVVLDKKTKM